VAATAVQPDPEMLDAFSETFTALIKDGEAYLFLLPIYTILLVGERIAHHFLSDRKWNNWDTHANIVVTVVHLVLDVLVGKLAPLALMALIYENARLFSLDFGPVAWVIVFLLHDLAWYVDHRLAHRTGFFWAMHHVHHSSAEYNMTVASRGFFLDITFLSRPTFYLLPLLGVSPLQFIVITIVTNVLGIAQHTRLVGKLGWIDWLFATPSSHRVHHGSDTKYLDKNYGEILMIWDHLFGSYQPEEEEPVYGVTEPIDTYNPLRIEVAGLVWLGRKMRRADGAANKLRCLFYPPGWEPPTIAGAAG
jgi:sterol desaturase/sphingolipid hydroxylase (fatty acid hydroxylase superfamily)